MFIQSIFNEGVQENCQAKNQVSGKERREQAGFSLVEVSVVMAIVLLLAIIAIPTVRSYVIESKVPRVGEELARFVLHAKVNASDGSATPYGSIATVNLANMLRDSGLFSVTGSGASQTVRH
ncbi:MAG: prepilin-type N-terminal cleavage/methylation domain-containing protein, partial [Alcaligenaceae bacterium]|nr:prepilin-type N-terminal cleavage/methylation domain-containing protein [Alcaligenaceae bacterium]